MRWDHQLESKIAFSIAALMQLLVLLLPWQGKPAVLWSIFHEMQERIPWPSLEFVLLASLFLSLNLLWLASPFLIRVYAQFEAVLWLAILLSTIMTVGAGLLFFLMLVSGEFLFIYVGPMLAATAHLIGMFRIRREGPDEEDFLR